MNKLRVAAAAAALMAALALAPSAAGADEPSDIRAVIEGQVAAFAAGDAHKAFGFATPSIQAQFGSSAFFMQMVESGYGALVRPRDFEIVEIRTEGDVAAARARVVAKDGRAYDALYPLRRQPDGAWRIDGCQLKPAEGRSL